ncbi:protein tyrosine/serine phosphatase [Burkholderia sp. H160]|nr:protein tyrosine/serine phosphatase [Burkholderia sp. H160]
MSAPSGPAQPARHQALQGGCNFRDLGGYPTADGRQTRWGVLYRSASLAFLTEEDLRCLAPLGVRTICDLRRDDEAANEPTRWPHQTDRRQWAIDAALVRQQRSRAWERLQDKVAAEEVMLHAYRTMHTDLRPQVEGVFRCVRENAVPMVFHCAAGKDRTGFLAALVLHALGVPRAVILEDYLLTNDAGLAAFVDSYQRASMGVTQAESGFATMHPMVRQALLGADARYLSAAFESIEQAYGSVEGYLAHVLQFSEADFDAVRDRLLV